MINQNKMEKDIFEKELALCRKLSKKNNGKCNWGECERCGVIPLLYKLYKGRLLESRDEIKEVRDSELYKI